MMRHKLFMSLVMFFSPAVLPFLFGGNWNWLFSLGVVFAYWTGIADGKEPRHD